ncbi:ASC1-like protein [Selaginella moellendorffii]|nr:ASC1-like protein [Selaginella moellendorffii]|eukprot:XP_002982720.2 ASC1-like protein [Selaginella moellendorffii]
MAMAGVWRWPGWEVESYPKLTDLAMVPLFGLFFPAVRFVLDRFVFEVLGRRFIARAKGDDQQFAKTLIKFKESAWKAVYFTSADLFALLITYREPWFHNTKYFWIGPGDQVWPDQKIKLKLKLLYTFSAGFYIYSMLALVFWETRRKDFGVSMTHHVVTFLLIAGSYPSRFARVGSMVLALHDAGDIFLEMAKMSRYAGSDIFSSVFFVMFAIAWVLLRLIYFPFWIIWSTCREIVGTLDKNAHKTYGPVMYYGFNTFLITLLVMHIYWWILIVRVLLKQIEDKGKIEKDVRSDSEDDSDD